MLSITEDNMEEDLVNFYDEMNSSVIRVETFEEAGLLTRDKGVQVTLDDGTVYQISIKRAKWFEGKWFLVSHGTGYLVDTKPEIVLWNRFMHRWPSELGTSLLKRLTKVWILPGVPLSRRTEELWFTHEKSASCGLDRGVFGPSGKKFRDCHVQEDSGI